MNAGARKCTRIRVSCASPMHRWSYSNLLHYHAHIAYTHIHHAYKIATTQPSVSMRHLIHPCPPHAIAQLDLCWQRESKRTHSHTRTALLRTPPASLTGCAVDPIPSRMPALRHQHAQPPPPPSPSPNSAPPRLIRCRHCSAPRACFPHHQPHTQHLRHARVSPSSRPTRHFSEAFLAVLPSTSGYAGMRM